MELSTGEVQKFDAAEAAAERQERAADSRPRETAGAAEAEDIVREIAKETNDEAREMTLELNTETKALGEDIGTRYESPMTAEESAEAGAIGAQAEAAQAELQQEIALATASPAETAPSAPAETPKETSPAQALEANLRDLEDQYKDARKEGNADKKAALERQMDEATTKLQEARAAEKAGAGQYKTEINAANAAVLEQAGETMPLSVKYEGILREKEQEYAEAKKAGDRDRMKKLEDELETGTKQWQDARRDEGRSASAAEAPGAEARAEEPEIALESPADQDARVKGEQRAARIEAMGARVDAAMAAEDAGEKPLELMTPEEQQERAAAQAGDETPKPEPSGLETEDEAKAREAKEKEAKGQAEQERAAQEKAGREATAEAEREEAKGSEAARELSAAEKANEDRIRHLEKLLKDATNPESTKDQLDKVEKELQAAQKGAAETFGKIWEARRDVKEHGTAAERAIGGLYKEWKDGKGKDVKEFMESMSTLLGGDKVKLENQMLDKMSSQREKFNKRMEDLNEKAGELNKRALELVEHRRELLEKKEGAKDLAEDDPKKKEIAKDEKQVDDDAKKLDADRATLDADVQALEAERLQIEKEMEEAERARKESEEREEKEKQDASATKPDISPASIAPEKDADDAVGDAGDEPPAKMAA